MPTIDVLLPGLPFGCDSGTFGMCAVVLVEGPGPDGGTTRMLVDTGHVGRRRHLLAALRARGLAAADIDLVVLTHAHWDHIQNTDVFAHATVLLHPAELHYLRSPHPEDWATPSWTAEILADARVLDSAEPDRPMPGTQLLDLPGHTAGTMGVRVDTADGPALVVGDALPRAAAVPTGRHPLVFADAEAADRSMRRICDLSRDEDAVIYPGHDRPFRTDGTETTYTGSVPEVTVTGLTPAAATFHVTESVPISHTLRPGLPNRP